MAETKERLNIYQKLARIREIADAVKRSKRGFNYTYADITDILAKVRAGEKNYGVSLIPLISSGTMSVEPLVTVNTKTDKAGNTYDQTTTEMLFRAEMTWRWVNDENPSEFLDVPWIVTGAQADPSQAFGSGMTYTQRQFLTAFFQIPQSDQDPDAIRTKQREAEHAEDRAIAESIAHEIDKLVQPYVAENPENRDKAMKIITRYIKGGNYFKITDPDVAAKLLEELKSKLTKGKDA